MTKICVASDLHYDIPGQDPVAWPQPGEVDVVVIAGDTANDIGTAVKALRKISRRTAAPVLWVDGNHEHYSNAPQGRTVARTMQRLAELCPESCIFLPAHGVVTIAGLRFVGRNGWYDGRSPRGIEREERYWREAMNDDRWIGFTAMEQPKPWDLARRDADDLDALLRDSPGTTVVVTHTSPHRSTLSRALEHLSTNPFYVNTHMERVLWSHGGKVPLWIHGHTHLTGMSDVEGTTVVRNPRGYPRENPRWQPVVLEV